MDHKVTDNGDGTYTHEFDTTEGNAPVINADDVFWSPVSGEITIFGFTREPRPPKIRRGRRKKRGGVLLRLK